VGSTWIMDIYKPIQMGNWMTKGPRHPIGFTPDSLYSFMVSWERRALSLAYFVCNAFSLGWSMDIFWVERIWRRLRGSVTMRTMIVNTMMAMPKFCPKYA
jgi:hypothetical protein